MKLKATVARQPRIINVDMTRDNEKRSKLVVRWKPYSYGISLNFGISN